MAEEIPTEGRVPTQEERHAPPLHRFANHIKIAAKRNPKLMRLVTWFKEPSNILSVIAIVAVLMVPWVEKAAKSDEELRAEIDTLIESTKKITQYNERRFSAGDSEMFSDAIASSQRQNDLDRATALASRIRRDVYPSVLLALANELCASANYPLAQSYIDEVLNRGTWIHFLSPRPSNLELSSAHVVKAKCYVQQFQGSGRVGQEQKKIVDREMSDAVSLLQPANSDQQLGQVAITYAGWAFAEEQMGDNPQAEIHRQAARNMARRMKFLDPSIRAVVDPLGGAKPEIPASIREDSLPRRFAYDTYMVNFPDNPEDTAAFLYAAPKVQGDFSSASASLFMYRHGLFAELEEDSSWTTHNAAGKHELTEIDFQTTVPTLQASGSTPKVQLIWTIEKMAQDRIEGVQSELRQAPRRFVARLSPNPEAKSKITPTN